ncbi:MAG TPA: hypothetical protein VNZ54_02030, partial [bacterium]|nr:hypothetical protein [bacterium]
MEKPGPVGHLSWRQLVIGALYAVAAGLVAWQVVGHTNAAAGATDQINEAQNFGNEGAQVSAKFVKQHRIVGSYLAKDLDRDFKLPSFEDSSKALGQIPALARLAAQEEDQASWWSWCLLGLSAVYLVLASMRPGQELARNLLFAITSVSAVFFVVGVSATALEIFTVIRNFFGTTPVIQHQVRSIDSVIRELFTTGHWIFGGFIALFSIAT